MLRVWRRIKIIAHSTTKENNSIRRYHCNNPVNYNTLLPSPSTYWTQRNNSERKSSGKWELPGKSLPNPQEPWKPPKQLRNWGESVLLVYSFDNARYRLHEFPDLIRHLMSKVTSYQKFLFTKSTSRTIENQKQSLSTNKKWSTDQSLIKTMLLQSWPISKLWAIWRYVHSTLQVLEIQFVRDNVVVCGGVFEQKIKVRALCKIFTRKITTRMQEKRFEQKNDRAIMQFLRRIQCAAWRVIM